jgi:hypothetical protein
MYSREYTSGFSGPVAASLAAPLSPRHEGNVGQLLVRYIHERLLQSPIRCFDEPSADGLASRSLTVLLGTGVLLFGACPRLMSVIERTEWRSVMAPLINNRGTLWSK